MLQRRDTVPDFTVVTVDGRQVEYATLWQRRNLSLVSVPPDASPARASYIQSLTDCRHELAAYETECVVTSETVPGMPSPGVLVADRWGEIHFIAGAVRVEGLPPASEIVEWVRYVAYQCPECQGEAR